MRRFLTLLATLAGLLVLASPASAQSNLRFPALSGRIVDQANLLSPAAESQLTAKLEALERDTGDQFVVATVDSLQDREIEEYGYQLGRAWGIGQAATDRGVILLVAPNERKVRIEVGYGLEPILTDALSSTIIQTRILPSFRTGGFETGIARGADAVIEQLRLDPETAQQRAAAAAQTRSQATRSRPAIGPTVMLALIFVFLMMGFAGRGAGGRRRRRNGLDPLLVWTAAEVLSQASRRGGGGGWGGGGGGGFGGGGGSFGGGGASGGW